MADEKVTEVTYVLEGVYLQGGNGDDMLNGGPSNNDSGERGAW